MGRHFTIATYPANEVLPFTGSNTRPSMKCTVKGVDYYASLHSLRFDTFKKNDCTCVECGRRGTVMGLDLPRGIRVSVGSRTVFK